jgi:hypothetical protein
LLSAIALSDVDEAGAARDGLLRLHEIVELRLAASLVVLSACETALGRDVPGEGMIGLARGFLHAGAGQVVASLWRVHDQGTAELMARFYAGLLRDRLAPAAALRQAQLALRAEPRWSSPYYWASFAIRALTRARRRTGDRYRAGDVAARALRRDVRPPRPPLGHFSQMKLSDVMHLLSFHSPSSYSWPQSSSPSSLGFPPAQLW